MSELVGTTNRVISLLRLLAESKGTVGVKNVADALNLPMSTSHRLLDMMTEAGFVEKDQVRRRYGVGMEYFRIANLVAQRPSAALTLQPILDKITETTGESTILSVYLPTQRRMTYAAKCDTPESLRYKIDLFEQLPLEWGSTGLAILAWLPEAVQSQIFEESQPSPVSGKRMTRAAFDARIARTRRDGFALTESEKVPDSIGIAAPLFSGPGVIFGSLAVTIPKFRFDRSKTDDIALLLRKAASRFSGPNAAGSDI